MTDLKHLTLKFLHEAMGKGRKDILRELLHPEYKPQEFSVKKWEKMALEIGNGDENSTSLFEVIQAFHEKMEHLEFEIKGIIQEDNRVAVFWTARGVGYQPGSIGDEINLDWSTDGAHLIVFKDDKIFRLQYIADTLSAFIQGKLAFIQDDQNQMLMYVTALKNLGLY